MSFGAELKVQELKAFFKISGEIWENTIVPPSCSAFPVKQKKRPEIDALL